MMSEPITPKVATDIIIELIDRPAPYPIVLVERRFEPYGWCIPGGFVEVGESVEQAARREAFEETQLKVTLKHLLGVYSDPKRDPRLHCVSIVYVATATGMPMAADDAKDFQICIPDNWPKRLCFDHAQMLQDYLKFRSMRS